MPKATVLSIPEQSLKMDNLPHRNDKRSRRISVWVQVKAWLTSTVIENITLLCIGFLLGRVVIMGELAPVGLAFFAAVLFTVPSKALTVGLMTTLGIISVGFYTEVLVYLSAIFLMIKLEGYKFYRNIPKIFSTQLVVGIVGLGAVFLQSLPLYSAILAIINAIMCGILMYIFKGGIPLLSKNNEIKIKGEATIFLVVLLAAAVTGIGDLAILDYSVRSIAGNFMVLVLAYLSGAGMGTALGVGIGLVIGLTDPAGPSLSVMMYALSGLLGGVCRILGRLGVLIGFAFGSIATIFYLNQSQLLPNVVAEVTMASGFFLMVSQERLSKWRVLLEQVSGRSIYQEFMFPAAEKLTGMASLFGEMATSIEKSQQVSIKKIREKNLAKMLTCIGENLCEDCNKRKDCWDNRFSETYQAMLNMYYEAERGHLNRRSLPKLLKEQCINSHDLLDKALGAVECVQVQDDWQKDITDSRNVVYEQVSAIQEILGSLAMEMKQEPVDDYEVAQSIKDKAALLSCPLHSVKVNQDCEQKKIHISKAPCQGTKDCQNTVLPLAANILREKLHMKAVCGSKLKACDLQMETVDRYSVEAGVAFVTKNHGDISGDSYAIIPSRNGKLALLISDGMGSGKKAEQESQSTISFLKKLLEIGFNIDSAVKTVNSMLLLTTPGENFATMDMVVIDRFTGITQFFKIGAAPSFIKRICEVSTISGSSLPVGILNNLEPVQIQRHLVAGDIVVIVSDGVLEATEFKARSEQKEYWLANFLRHIHSNDPQTIADEILAVAVKNSGVVKDDMTVLVAKIVEAVK